VRPTRKPTLWERQAAFVQTFTTLRDEVTIPGGVQHPQIVAALIEASAALVVGADLDGSGTENWMPRSLTDLADEDDLLDTVMGTD